MRNMTFERDEDGLTVKDLYVEEKFVVDEALMIRYLEDCRRDSSVRGAIKGILPPNVAWISPGRDRLIMIEPPTHRMLTVRLRTALVCECEWGNREVEECSGDCSNHCGASSCVECGNPEDQECNCVGEEYKIFECALCLGEDDYSTHKGDIDSADWEKFYLPFPYLVYVIDVSQNELTLRQILAANEPPTEDTMLYSVPVPNLYMDGSICAGTGGTVYVRSFEEELSIVDGTSSVIDGFWSSAFNFDVMEYKDMATWKEMVRNVDEYWLDAKTWSFWESLDFDELMNLLPWEDDAQFCLSELMVAKMPNDRKFHLGTSRAFFSDVYKAVSASALKRTPLYLEDQDHGFQKGDKVVITSNSQRLRHYFDIGKVCRVIGVSRGVPGGRPSLTLEPWVTEASGYKTQVVLPSCIERAPEDDKSEPPAQMDMLDQLHEEKNTIRRSAVLPEMKVYGGGGGQYTVHYKTQIDLDKTQIDLDWPAGKDAF